MKQALLAVSLLITAAAGAVTADYRWNKMLRADGTTDLQQVCPDGDGGCYIIGGYSKVSESLSWGGEAVTFDPSAADLDNSIVLARLNADGTAKWIVTTTAANFLNNSFKIASTPDGSVVVAANARFGKEAAGAPTLFSLKDTKGTTTILEYDLAPAGKNPQQGILFSLNKEGAWLWGRSITATPVVMNGDAEGYTATPITLNALSVDPHGDIFVAAKIQGNYQDKVPQAPDLVFNASNTVTAGGTAAWLRFDPDGKPAGVTVEPAAAKALSASSTAAIFADGSTLYTASAATPEGGKQTLRVTAIAYDQNSIAAEYTYDTFFDSEVVGTAKSVSVQPANIEKAGETIYVTGAMNGKLSLGEAAFASPEAKLYGFACAIKAGAAPSFYIHNAGISKYSSVIEDKAAGKIYALGSLLQNGYISVNEFPIAQPGTLSTVKDADITKLFESSAKGMNTIYSTCFDPESKLLIALDRVNTQTKFHGTETLSEDTKIFSGLAAAWSLPDVNASTGIENVASAPSADNAAPVEYYSLQGQRLSNPAPGTLVIRRQGATAAKVIL